MAHLKGTGLTRASQISQAHLEDYQKELLSTLSQRAVRNYMYVASGLLSFAVGRGYLSAHVVKNVKKVKADKNPPRYLSFDEWEQVEAIAQRSHLWPLVATAYYTGFRNSELRFLTWEEVDFDQGLITLHNKALHTRSPQDRYGTGLTGTRVVRVSGLVNAVHRSCHVRRLDERREQLRVEVLLIRRGARRTSKKRSPPAECARWFLMGARLLLAGGCDGSTQGSNGYARFGARPGSDACGRPDGSA